MFSTPANYSKSSYWVRETRRPCVGVVTGVPIVEPEARNVATIGSFTIPQLGLTVQTTHWHSKVTRTGWFTSEAVVGARVLDASALKIVKST